MSSVSMMNRKLIVRCCKNRGWTIQPNALQYMIEYMIAAEFDSNSNVNEQTEAIQSILDNISQYMIKNSSTSSIITKDIVMEATTTKNNIDIYNNNNNNKPNNKRTSTTNDTSLSSLLLLKENTNPTSSNSNERLVVESKSTNYSSNDNNSNNNTNDFLIINAFDTMPRLTYDETRHQFNIQDVTDNNESCSLFGTAEDKIAMFAERYTLIHQRLLRHPLFRPSILSKLPNSSSNDKKSFHSMNNTIQHKLTPIESLLGGGGGSNTGSGNKNTTTVLLLGILLQIEENQYYLEDLTGYVSCIFNESIDINGFFITEHCIVLVEGYYYDSKFYIERLGHPLIESRPVSLNAIQQQLSHSFYNNTISSQSQHKYNSTTTTIDVNNNNNKSSSSSLSFVILSDICMDHPRVVQKLEIIFARYATKNASNNNNTNNTNLPCFILMGNFVTPTSLLVQQQQHVQQQQSQQNTNTSSTSFTNNRTVTAIEELIQLIEKFTILAKYAHFVLVPGPNDYSILGNTNLHILPLPPLNTIMKRTLTTINKNNKTNQKIIANLHYGSNPCRIRWNCKEIVLFRYDLLPIFQQNEVLVPKHHINNSNNNNVDDTMNLSMSQDDVLDLDNDNDDNQNQHHRLPSCRLVKTILDQGHLLPIPNQPIYWNYDSSLRLYPLPDAVILGGNNNYSNTNTAYEPFHEIYSGCHVLSPGSLMNSILSENAQQSTSSSFTKNNTSIPKTTANTSSHAYFTLDDNTNRTSSGINLSSQTTINDNTDHEILNDASTVDFLD